VEAGKRIKAAGIELSAYYMPGLGGCDLWEENALETADLMNQVDPDFIRMRTLAIPDRLELAADVRAGRFSKAGDVENAREIKLFLEHLDGISSTVVSDHIVNLLQDLEGRLPEDRTAWSSNSRPSWAWTRKEQALYRLGRRGGLFAGLSDLLDPQSRAAAGTSAPRVGRHRRHHRRRHRRTGQALHLNVLLSDKLITA